jgi:polysaccharide export outer membrane protein
MPLLALLVYCAGCGAAREECNLHRPVPDTVPRELYKTALPPYRIEPPDIVLIDAVRVIPRQPYHLRTLDTLKIRVPGAISESPIDAIYPVELGGTINLGPPYGPVRVTDLTVEEAQRAIEEQLHKFLKEPAATVSLVDIAGKQMIAGAHMVGPDGTVTLGTYGSVPLVGMTLAEARGTIEQHLSQFLDNPEVSVEIYAYNSKVYYIITQGANMGDAVYRFPVTGNETVLDAMAQINGMSQISSKKIWIARPTCEPGKTQLLAVDWDAIVAQGQVDTNYQLLPGDRLYISEDKLVALDTAMGKILAPIERAMGFSMLGVGTVTRFSGPVLQGGGNANASF